MQKSRIKLSTAGLLDDAFQFFTKKFSQFENKRRATDPSIVDSLMACIAMLHLKFPSLIKFDVARREEPLLGNLKTLYHVENPPCDTTMREKLDVLEPSDVRGVFKRLFACAQRGKVLKQYEFWNGHLLMAMDGTSLFSSPNVRCENCCVKHRGEKNESYYHQALGLVCVHPNMKRVIPLAPEAITQQDGATKNDCELNAAKRLLNDFRREHPHQKAVIGGDSLFTVGPFVELLKEHDLRFILGAKPGNLGYLFDWVKHVELGEYSYVELKSRVKKGPLYIRHTFRFTNNVPLNDTHFESKVNFLDYMETNEESGETKHFSWITDIPLNDKTVGLVMRGGRARWRIENETFNTLKNQGYNFEHNFGHGDKNLCTVMTMLMFLVFAIDQVSELNRPGRRPEHTKRCGNGCGFSLPLQALSPGTLSLALLQTIEL